MAGAALPASNYLSIENFVVGGDGYDQMSVDLCGSDGRDVAMWMQWIRQFSIAGRGPWNYHSDFAPLGSNHGPMDLKRFTVPSTGTYQCILSAGPRQPALPKPWIRLLAGHVYATNQSFFAAYANGAGVLAQKSGDSIAQVVLTAEEGDQFTFIFSSKSGGTGAYSWRVVKM